MHLSARLRGSQCASDSASQDGLACTEWLQMPLESEFASDPPPASSLLNSETPVKQTEIGFASDSKTRDSKRDRTEI
eukprot:8565904-Lingulodinium_polyedra.AAC.1